MNKLSRLAIPLFGLLAAAGAQGQSSCASDGLPQPVALLERFISADCESCWSDPKTARPGRGELALDWIVPGSRGDDAPLSAAASRDSLERLHALGRKPPLQAEASRLKPRPDGSQLRVAHGLPFDNYIGTSIELKPASGGPWKAWLLLVETVPSGTEGSPVERNLVRNALQTAWDNTTQLSKEEQNRLLESRPMSIPEGANRERLRVVGWVEDARGQIVAAAQSRCRPAAR
ncbi:hypothetical protein [Caenimonas soli]|jgi:hypothetical protein|uniref:hypothetical protein n=1 Tax=Caenimonas soli TaxID=2735555 RepID=UPI00155799F9|nr:hypothetical protein [Caenimonas soli]NPC55444.1 hypothetical protein [Caenimonas soli]